MAGTCYEDRSGACTWQLFWDPFFREAISAISMARMAIKPYIIQKRIAWTLIWLLKYNSIFNGSREISE